MLTNKKKLIYIILAIVLVIGVGTGTVLVLSAIKNSSPSQDTDIVSKTTANNLKTQAMDALKNHDTAKAKTLFQQAQQQYTTLGDTNNMIDTAAQLYLIDHPVTTTPVK